jgi:hypothetical protein
MAQSIIDIAILFAAFRTLGSMGRRFEIPVPVVPGHQHILLKPLLCFASGQLHGLLIIADPVFRVKADNFHL